MTNFFDTLVPTLVHVTESGSTEMGKDYSPLGDMSSMGPGWLAEGRFLESKRGEAEQLVHQRKTMSIRMA